MEKIMYDQAVSLLEVLPMRSGYGLDYIGRENALIVGPNSHEESLRIIEIHGDEMVNIPSIASGVTDFELQKPGGLYKSMLNNVIVGDLEVIPERGCSFAHALLGGIDACPISILRGYLNWAQ